MTQRDVLREAAAAMRQQYDGQHSGSGFTRARIMRSLQARRRRSFSVWWLTPATILIVGSTAWASATGRLPQWIEQVVAVVRPAPVAPARSTSPPEPGPPSNVSRALPEAAPSSESPLGVSEPQAPPVEVQPASSLSMAARPRSIRSSVPPSQVQVSAPAPTEPPTEEEHNPPDPDIAAFRDAHRVHFGGGSPRQAIAEYQRYLAAFPSGRFVPEARYNIALNLVKLGRRAEARQALSAFARGRYGDYRRAEAQALLAALDAAQPKHAPGAGGQTRPAASPQK